MRKQSEISNLHTDRLLLRQWRESDFPPFAELNANADVMKFFPKCLSAEESNTLAQRCQSLISDRGWGFWAVELKNANTFIGFVGLHEVKPIMPFSPSVEIGWRLHRAHWGRGYATEAATEALTYAFVHLALGEVVSLTTISNARSRSVMTRLGLTDTGRNFHHPDIPEGHPLSEHVLYKISRVEWQASVVDKK